MLPKSLRDKLITQSLDEIDRARKYKKGRLSQWQANEDLVFGKKPPTIPHRSNVMLPKMQGFENTLLSKIRNFPALKYLKGEEADLKKAKRMTALLEQTAKPTNGNWKFKDLMGKKSGIRYGRAIFEAYGESVKGFKFHLNPVSPYDFLIDAGAGGIDIEDALNLGRTGIYLNSTQIKQGIKDGRYLRTESYQLLNEGSNTDEKAEEQKNKDNRYFALIGTPRHSTSSDLYKFWRWFTTFEGTRYMLLLNEQGKTAIRVEELTEVFKSGKWPFATWATDPDLDEFWTPGPDDGVREIFYAQSKAINQMLDNNEDINEPMKGYDVDKVVDASLLNKRRSGLIPFKKDTDINKAIQVFQPQPIQNGITVYDKLDQIQQLESGVTAESRGVSDEDKVAIYEGNQANIADRLGLLNDSYAIFYHRLMELFEHAVREHLTMKVAIQMIGIDGVEVEEVTKTDLLPEDTSFDYYISASDAEMRNDIGLKRAKLQYVAANKQNPIINQKVLAEIEAEIAGFEADDIKRLRDVDEFGDAELMSECARDIQRIITGEDVEPNEAANVAYKQKMVDYLRDKSENLKPEVIEKLMAYIEAIEPYVIRNTVRKANEVNAKAGSLALPLDPAADPSAPMQPQQAQPELIQY